MNRQGAEHAKDFFMFFLVAFLARIRSRGPNNEPITLVHAALKNPARPAYASVSDGAFRVALKRRLARKASRGLRFKKRGKSAGLAGFFGVPLALLSKLSAES